jgi:hypothetical protein
MGQTKGDLAYERVVCRVHGVACAALCVYGDWQRQPREPAARSNEERRHDLQREEREPEHGAGGMAPPEKGENLKYLKKRLNGTPAVE